ncbi:hypothetical protein M422DRAFT_202467 [Sphaerobolus stellatus SS14]|nr:hypothetical protein M422DRAFT_202467 [Sphaerobolus stellatus SS14]
MARFGLIDSDDEDIPVQNVAKPVQEVKEPSRPEAPSTKGKERAVSPPMEVDELRESPRRRKKPAANAFVEDESGEPRFAHELRSQRWEVEESSEEDGLEEGIEDEEIVELDASSRRMPAPWPAQVGVEPHRMHVMQTSFFRVPEEQAALKASTQRRTGFGKLRTKGQTEKLLSASARLARKHSRGSEGGDGGMRLDKTGRASFDHSLDPEPYKPARKVMRVQGSQSLSSGQESAYADAGLAFGRSFRVSWGPGGQLTRIGGLSNSIVHIETIPIAEDDKSDKDEKVPSSRLLDVQIGHTTIELDEEEVPVAFPSRSLTFSTFATIFPKHDRSHEAELWREGVALFDPFPQPTSDHLTPAIKHRLIAIQRRKALGGWLSDAVSPTVANALREELSASSAQRAFTRLTGHQVEEAAEAAVTEGNPNLGLLVSQAGGGVPFKADLDSQLSIWAEEGSDRLIDEAYRKCLALLSGATDVWRPSNDTSGARDINVVKGLDWKRAFGLTLWYGVGSEGVDGYEGALEQFQQIMGENSAPLPVPWYKEGQSTLTTADDSLEEADAMFEMLRLATAEIPLERAIYPRAFGPNRLDYRLTWHLYILFSRAMRMKDFSDREPAGGEDENEAEGQFEGHSEMADSVTTAYAAQLEALGQLQKAAFVLLHLESAKGRKRALKELLARQAHELQDWQVLGLQSLKIPTEWIEEAKAYLAQYEGRTFDAYEHFLKADQQRIAHDIAVNDLAPDAIIRGELALLRALFRPFDPQAVDDWSFRGKLFLDYVDATERIPELIVALQENAILDASDAMELDRLRNLIPQLIRALPDVFRDRNDPRHNAALSEMLSGLLSRYDSIKTKSTVQPDFDATLVDEATRLKHIHGAAYNRFIQAVSTMA